MSAFDEIHGLGVVHGDIRTANILVGRDRMVWIVDFEFSHAVAEGDAGAWLLSDERVAVLEMLRYLKEEDGADFEINRPRDWSNLSVIYHYVSFEVPIIVWACICMPPWPKFFSVYLGR